MYVRYKAKHYTLRSSLQSLCAVDGKIEAAAEPFYCRVLGWLLLNRKDCQVIVQHITDEKTKIYCYRLRRPYDPPSLNSKNNNAKVVITCDPCREVAHVQLRL